MRSTLFALLAVAALSLVPAAGFAQNCGACPAWLVPMGGGSTVICPAEGVVLVLGAGATIRMLNVIDPGDGAGGCQPPRVSLQDFGCFGIHWLEDTRPMTQNCDFTDDGVVGPADFAVFAMHWQH